MIESTLSEVPLNYSLTACLLFVEYLYTDEPNVKDVDIETMKELILLSNQYNVVRFTVRSNNNLSITQRQIHQGNFIEISFISVGILSNSTS